MLLSPAPRAGGTIAAGDLVVVYEGHDALRFLTVAPGTVLRCKHGAFPHAAWVGQPFGARVTGSDGRGWLLLLRPTPALWTRVLRHRTQILYTPDIATIVANLGLAPGRVVLESGTGSGSLTTSLARAVAPSGRVYSFEFHAQRAEAARCAPALRVASGAPRSTQPPALTRACPPRRSADFALTGVAQVVTVFVRDTEATGFPASLAGGADAVFLDLPGPHRVAPSAVASLRPDGMLCSFSPCIEQVQRMCIALEEEGMTEIRTIEVLNREYEFQRRQLLLPPPLSDGAGEAVAAGAANDVEGSRKRARTDGEAGAGAADAPAAEAGGAHGAAEAAAAMPDEAPAAAAEGAAAPAAGKQGKERRRNVPQSQPLARADARLLVWPAAEARGHTGYLTFARKPTEERNGAAAAGESDGDA